MNDEMNNAMDELFNAINEDYVRWATVAFAKSELTSDPSPDWTLEAKPGRSYIKIIKNEGPNRGSVWGFVVKKDSAKFKEGDIVSLPPVDGVDFFVKDKLLFKAEIGETNSQVAVSLKDRL